MIVGIKIVKFYLDQNSTQPKQYNYLLITRQATAA